MSIVMITIFLLFVFLAASFVFLLSKLKNNKSSKLPPGSLGWPLIGETFEMTQMTRNGMEDIFVRSRMEKYDNRVFKTSIFGETVFYFCGAAANKLLFSNEDKLVKVWWPSSASKLFAITKVAGEGKWLRGMILTFLDPKALQRYTKTIDKIAQHHFETKWEGREEVKAYPLVKMYAFELACRLFLGIDEPEQIMKLLDEINILIKGVFSTPLNIPGTRFYRATRAADVIRGKIQEMINHRRAALEEKTASPTRDLVSHLLVNPDEAGRFMTETEIQNNILGLLFAGHDTPSSVLTLAIKYLEELPEVYDKVLKEQMEIVESKGAREFLEWGDIQKMTYTWNVVSEVMRIFPPGSGAFREAIVDFNFAGYTIPKGSKLTWSMYSTCNDPNIFPNPTKFDPSRFEGEGPKPFTHIPFGGGPRMCLGKEFARVEILVFLHNVVKRFKWELLSRDEKIETDPLAVPNKGLPIRLQPHQF